MADPRRNKPPFKYPVRLVTAKNSAYSTTGKLLDANGSIIMTGVLGEWGVKALQDMVERANEHESEYPAP